MENKIRVVLSALLFPFTMAHLFWRAFERREDVDLFVTGPFYGDYIPWNNGMRLPQKYVKYPNLPLPHETPTGVSPVVVESQLPWEPDLWIQIDAGWCFGSRPKAKNVVHVATDPHVLNYDKPRKYTDIFFSMQTPYMKPGDIYLPYAFDPSIHYPMDVEKEYDACLVGLLYEQRMQLIKGIQARGLSVYYGTGEVYDEYRLRYNKSRVAISWSSLLDLPARNWEAMGMHVPLVANIVPDMRNFFVSGEHYMGFEKVEEGVDAVVKLVEDKELADWMADNAYRKVAVHTWDHRVNQILETVHLI